MYALSWYPKQLEIALSTQCNQICDYCWVRKSREKEICFSAVQKGIDLFLSSPLLEQTITFTTFEPLIKFNLFQKALDYLCVQVRTYKKKINIIATTNGVLLTRERQSFLMNKFSALKNSLNLNFSLDGMQRSHDAHRRLKNNPKGSAFKESWRHLKCLPPSFPRIIFTISPDEVELLRVNADFILKNKFLKIDIFPQLFILWNVRQLALLKQSLIELVQRANALNCKRDIRFLNRLWSSSCYEKVLLGSNEKFYLFEAVALLPLKLRSRFCIGDVNEGMDLKKRQQLFKTLFQECNRASRKKCLSCSRRELCGFPLPLYLWCRYHKKPFLRYLDNFCQLASIMIETSKMLSGSAQNFLDKKRLSIDRYGF